MECKSLKNNCRRYKKIGNKIQITERINVQNKENIKSFDLINKTEDDASLKSDQTSMYPPFLFVVLLLFGIRLPPRISFRVTRVDFTI